jgi:hypothetical protein
MRPSLNFPQLDFMRPLSGFHPVTWERVTKNAIDLQELIAILPQLQEDQIYYI